MDDIIHTEQVGKHTINIITDSDAASPFIIDWEGAALHLDFGREGDVITPNAKHLTRETIGEWLASHEPTITDTSSPFYGWAVFPVNAYIHGGVTVSLGSFKGCVPEGHARFDSGVCGVLLLAPGKPYDWAKGIIEAADDWLQGNVYGWEIVDEEGDVKDSCWGYYGNYETSGCLDDARRTALATK